MDDEENGYKEMAAQFAEAWPRVRKMGQLASVEPLKEWLDFQAFQYRIGEFQGFIGEDLDMATAYSNMAAALETVRLCVFGELDQSERYQTMRATLRKMEKRHEEASANE